MTPERWEAGSAFPLTALGRTARAEWLPKDAVLHGTGRQAIRALLQHGCDVHGWRRVRIGSYSCPGVVRALRGVLPIAYYPCTPGMENAPPEPRRNEVLVVTSLFGAQPQGSGDISRNDVILDVTHDPIAPWLADVSAGYVVASLRKTLPVPDGAATWSPCGLSLPEDPPPVSRHIEAVASGLHAMYLKSEYLDGADIEKDSFLSLYASMEKEFARSAPSRISAFTRSILRIFPVHEWRRQRLRNIRRLATAVSAIRGLTVLPSTFGVVLLVENHNQRERVRLRLLAARIYPAILWPMDTKNATSDDRDFAGRMISCMRISGGRSGTCTA